MTEKSDSKQKDIVTVNVISPSCPPVSFPDLPVSTTVNTLKNCIFQAAPAHPAVETQRLIFRGRPLVRGESTLKDVFTQDVIDSSDSVTIHLVTPFAHASQVQSQLRPQATTTTTNPQPAFTNGPTLPQSPQPFPTANISPSAQVTFSATFNHQPLANGTPQTSRQSTPSNLPRADQHDSSQTSNIQSSSAVPPQQTTSPTQNQQNLPADLPPHIQLHMQQMNALHAQVQAQIASQISALHQHPAFAGQSQIRFGPPYQSSIHGHFGNPHLPEYQAGPHITPWMPNNFIPTRPGQRPPTAQQPPWLAQNPPIHPSQGDLGGQGAQPQGTANAVGPDAPAEPLPSTTRDDNSRATNHQNHQNFPHSSSSEALMATSHIQQLSLQSPDASHGLYLLSSPNGPHALLLSPSGYYSAPWIAPASPAYHVPSTLANYQPSHWPLPNSNAPSRTSQVVNPNHEPTNPAQNQLVQRPQNLPPGEHPFARAVNNPPRDRARLFLQLSAHMWTLIRLLGFIYFFSNGASLSRTMFLVTLAFLLFLGQLGQLQGLWQAIRRYADNLLPGHEQPNAGRRRAQLTVAGPSAERRPAMEGTNRQSGDNQPQGNVVRQAFRGFERAAALFLASLAPGVAERHIQAREAAEAARQREIREREEREKKEEERRAQAASESGQGHEVGTSGSIDAGGSEREGLVEV